MLVAISKGTAPGGMGEWTSVPSIIPEESGVSGASGPFKPSSEKDDDKRPGWVKGLRIPVRSLAHEAGPVQVLAIPEPQVFQGYMSCSFCSKITPPGSVSCSRGHMACLNCATISLFCLKEIELVTDLDLTKLDQSNKVHGTNYVAKPGRGGPCGKPLLNEPRQLHQLHQLLFDFSQFECPNEGCTQPIYASEQDDHNLSCPFFGNTVCQFQEDCKLPFVHVAEYARHLKDSHDMTTTSSNKYVVLLDYQNSIEEKGRIKQLFRLGLLYFGLCIEKLDSRGIAIWLTYIGDSSCLAKGSTVTIQVNNGHKGGMSEMYTAEISCYEECEEIIDERKCILIPMECLHRFLVINVVEQTLSWRIDVDIQVPGYKKTEGDWIHLKAETYQKMIDEKAEKLKDFSFTAAMKPKIGEDNSVDSFYEKFIRLSQRHFGL